MNPAVIIRKLLSPKVLALIDACGHEVLYMHSTLQLISFYKTFGFVPSPRTSSPDN